MSELEQILQYEQQKKEEIAKARVAAQEFVRNKEEQLKKKLAASIGLGLDETQEILQKTQGKIKKLKNTYQKREKEAVDRLEKKKAANFEKAIDFVIANFQQE